MIDLIFFDFDGVLVESVDIKTTAFYQLFLNEGKDIADRVVEYHLKNAGVSRYEKFRYFYENILARPLSEEIFESLCRRFSELVVEEVVNAPYVKGAKEFLEDYASRYASFIVSATPQDEIEEIINRRMMTAWFRGVYGAPKRKKDIVKDILHKEGMNPSRTVYIGDALSDYQAAEENRVNFVARINGNESVFKDVACQKIMDLTTLRVVLDQLNSK